MRELGLSEAFRLGNRIRESCSVFSPKESSSKSNCEITIAMGMGGPNCCCHRYEAVCAFPEEAQDCIYQCISASLAAKIYLARFGTFTGDSQMLFVCLETSTVCLK